MTNTWNPDGQLAGWTATDGTNNQSAAFTYDSRGYRDSATLDGRTWGYGHTAAGDVAYIGQPGGREHVVPLRRRRPEGENRAS